MRLICPNCDAQYEVPDNVIPQGGRDVQCSNCGTTWFFKPGATEEAEDESPEVSAAPPAPTAAPPQEPTHAAEPEAGSQSADDFPQDAPSGSPTDAEAGTEGPAEPETTAPLDGMDAPEPEPEEPTSRPIPRRALDPALEEILREEADREARARAAEQTPLETQPDLGLDDMDTTDEATRRAEEARQRLARMHGAESEAGEPLVPVTADERAAGSAAMAAGAVAAASAAEGTRRGLLPDIDQINSTLRSEEDRETQQETEARHREDPTRRGGFGRGFIWTLALLAVAIAIYLAAPQIAEAIPSLAPVLESYVDAVNQLRGWLDAQVLAALGALDGLSSEAAPGE